MIDIDAIARQVKHNCNISDANYWGYYSPCGLLLRLRDLYKFEHALKPWAHLNHRHIAQWIETRESLWSELEGADFQQIEISGKQYGPYDSAKINALLTGHGYVYSAGYGNMLKPVFVLAVLAGDFKKDRYRVHRAGRELARDLSTSPAMIQGHTVFSREETMTHYFWDKYEEMRSKRHRGMLHRAFSEYGIGKDEGGTMTAEKLGAVITRIAQDELSVYLYHEYGEAAQRKMMGTWWKDLLSRMPYSRAELFLRALKDIRSDTCDTGMLAYIIQHRKTASLYFYSAFLSGYRQMLFPDIISACEGFARSRDWQLIEKARAEGHNKTGDYVRKLKAMCDTGGVTAELIEEELIP